MFPIEGRSCVPHSGGHVFPIVVVLCSLKWWSCVSQSDGCVFPIIVVVVCSLSSGMLLQ